MMPDETSKVNPHTWVEKIDDQLDRDRENVYKFSMFKRKSEPYTYDSSTMTLKEHEGTILKRKLTAYSKVIYAIRFEDSLTRSCLYVGQAVTPPGRNVKRPYKRLQEHWSGKLNELSQNMLAKHMAEDKDLSKQVGLRLERNDERMSFLETYCSFQIMGVPDDAQPRFVNWLEGLAIVHLKAKYNKNYDSPYKWHTRCSQCAYDIDYPTDTCEHCRK